MIYEILTVGYFFIWLVLMLKIAAELLFSGMRIKRMVRYFFRSVYVTAFWPLALLSRRGRYKLLEVVSCRHKHD